MARHSIDDEFAFDEREVRELRVRTAGKSDDVTDRRQPRFASEQRPRIDDDVAALELHVRELLQVEVLGHGTAANRAEEHLRLEDFRSLLRRHRALHHVAGELDLRVALGVDPDAG